MILNVEYMDSMFEVPVLLSPKILVVILLFFSLSQHRISVKCLSALFGVLEDNG
jgi:hypothetical protein